MARLAIISSYNESCGNASYTHVLKNSLSKYFDVEILALDLFLIQKDGSQFRKQADIHIKSIAEKIKNFDFVNIQFEAGLYGSNITDIRRRIGWLIDAAPNLIFTMHRLDPLKSTLAEIWLDFASHRSIPHLKHLIHSRRYEMLYKQIIAKVQLAANSKNAWICVHTKRDRRIVQEMYGFEQCFDYPLAFLTEEERNKAKAANDKAAFHSKYGFKKDSKIVGVFGYISAYKGVETALAALGYLPNNYVLAMFGSQHPQTIREHVEVDPFIGRLLNSIAELSKLKKHEDRANLEQFGQLKLIPKDAPKTLSEMRSGLVDRTRFMGNLSDPDFIEALSLCDAVVLPYLEVGQSMSGVLALALESDARMFVSNNYSFFEARKYYGETYFTFDIGNSLELAQKIQNSNKNFSKERDIVYKKYNIAELSNIFKEKFYTRKQRNI